MCLPDAPARQSVYRRNKWDSYLHSDMDASYGLTCCDIKLGLHYMKSFEAFLHFYCLNFELRFQGLQLGGRDLSNRSFSNIARNFIFDILVLEKLCQWHLDVFEARYQNAALACINFFPYNEPPL